MIRISKAVICGIGLVTSMLISPIAQAGYSVCRSGEFRGSYCFRYGDRGPLIYDFIEELRCAGYYTLNNDSYFGPVTRDAVIRIQRNNGLKPDGIAGPVTRNLVRRLCQY